MDVSYPRCWWLCSSRVLTSTCGPHAGGWAATCTNHVLTLLLATAGGSEGQPCGYQGQDRLAAWCEQHQGWQQGGEDQGLVWHPALLPLLPVHLT